MLKQMSKPLGFTQRVIDLSVVLVAWLTAWYVRFTYIPFARGGDFEVFLVLGAVLVIISAYVFDRNELYTPQRYHAWYREFIAVAVANVQVTLGFVFVLYAAAPDRVSRITIGLYLLIVEVLHLAVRVVRRRALRRLRAKGMNLRYALMIGDGAQNSAYVERVRAMPELGLDFCGWIDSRGRAAAFGVAEIEKAVGEAIEQLDPDMIVIGYEANDPRRFDRVLREAYNQTRPVYLLPQLPHVYLENSIEDFNGIPVLQINRPRIRFLDLVVKRVLDIIGSLLGLVLLSPLLLLVALAVKVTSRGPVFYGQERVTLNGAHFKMWKFRSMRVDAEQQNGAQWAVKDDPRRTPIGKFLRSSSIDELPQLWNVLIGEMSLVGPRPERPVFVEKFRKEIPGYMLRHTMKAGITGWAQANGWRGDTSLQKRIEFDIYYIKNWSLALDFEIVILTVIKGFVNENAY